MDDVTLAERFETNRPRLRAVALRMLGSTAEADDAVQEAWLRLSRADDGIDNLSAWLTTVVGRICLDMLRQRTARREDDYAYAEEQPTAEPDPEQQALMADSVGLALLVVLETLSPAERLAFVLHDLFAVSFDEIAPIVGRSPDAARQLASRARRRVHNKSEISERSDPKIVDAFLTAARGGEFATLLTMLDPDVEIRLEGVIKQRGADAVARFFSGSAQAAHTALIDGATGFVVVVDGTTLGVVRVTVEGGRITDFDATRDPAKIAELAIAEL
jgi:RNA polymerase sigma factor (sigma-70 family)